MRRIPCLVLLLGLPLGSCGALIEYADSLRRSDERTVVVRVTAQAGGVLGFIAGLPVDVVALPVTVPVHLYQSSSGSTSADLTDTLLFPSFTLLEVGSLIAAPVDLLEFAAFRAWQSPRTPTAKEQEEFEQKIDDMTLPRYPVETIYPKPAAAKG